MHNHTLRVQARMCQTCIFGPHSPVTEERRDELMAECQRKGIKFVCHQAIFAGHEDVACRGYYELAPSLVVILGHMLNLVEFVELEEKR